MTCTPCINLKTQHLKCIRHERTNGGMNGRKREYRCAMKMSEWKTKRKISKTIEMRLCRWHLSKKHKIYILVMPCARVQQRSIIFFSFSFRFKCRHSHAFFRHSTTFCMLLFWYYKDFNFKNVLLYIYVFCIKSWVRGCWNFSVDFSNHLKGHATTVEGSKEYSKFDSVLHFISCFKHPKIRVFREKKMKTLATIN